MAQEKKQRQAHTHDTTQVMSPKENMQGEAAACLILYWLLSIYLRHVIELLAYLIATIYWGVNTET